MAFQRQWTRAIGSPQDENGYSVSLGDDGSIVVCGLTRGNLHGLINLGVGDLVGNGGDGFLCLFNQDGTRQWTRLISSDRADAATGVTMGPDGTIYTSGWTNGNLEGGTSQDRQGGFLARYDREGNRQWIVSLGSDADNWATAIDSSLDGGVYVAGSTVGGLNGESNNGGQDGFLCSFSSDGQLNWTTLIGSDSFDSATGIATDANGSIYVCGRTEGPSLDSETSHGSADAFLSKFNRNGSLEWVRLIGSDRIDAANSVAVAADGSIYVCGVCTASLDGQGYGGGLSDGFLTKFDAAGNQQWTRTIGSASVDEATAVAVGDDGSIYVTGGTVINGSTTGSFYGEDIRYADAFIVKYDPNGQPQWQRLWGTAGWDGGASLATSKGGVLISLVNSSGGLDGQSNAGNALQNDAFITTFTDQNEHPTDVRLSASSCAENLPAGSRIALLSGSDPDTSDTLSFRLVAGIGDQDNGAFSIQGNALILNASPDYETKPSYRLRIECRDQAGLGFSKPFQLQIINRAESISSSTSTRIPSSKDSLILTGDQNISGIGNEADNKLTGNSGDNTLRGLAGNDDLNGGSGNDTLIGGLGRDIMSGSLGLDTFRYLSTDDSGVGRSKRDTISDFEGAKGETIDLASIDAFTGKPGNQAFQYIGAAPFTGLQGEVRFSHGTLQINTGVDNIADMEIALTSVKLFQTDFLVL